VYSLTVVHVALSVVSLAAGAPALTGLINARRPNGVVAIFVTPTTATSVSGFLFPFAHIGLGQVTGVLSLLVLVPAILGLYVFHLIGPWRWIYAAGAIAALYLNVVIGVAQAFAKVPALHTLAPTQSSLPFLLAQAVVLAAFVVLGAAAVRRFQPGMNPPSQRKRRPIGPPLTFNEDLRP
jgi:hypothetical protein